MENKKCWSVLEKLEPSCVASGNVKWCSTVTENFVIPQKFKVDLPYDLPIPLRGIYLRELKAFVLTKTCTHIYAALFIIANE